MKNEKIKLKKYVIHTNLFKELSIEESIEKVISSLELKVKDFLSYYHAKNTDLAWKQNDNLTLEGISSAILENRCKIIGLKIAKKIIKKQEEEYAEYINVEDRSFCGRGVKEMNDNQISFKYYEKLKEFYIELYEFEKILWQEESPHRLIVSRLTLKFCKFFSDFEKAE